MKKYNFNDFIILYPTQKGWQKIENLLSEYYGFSDKEINNWIVNRITDDFGYKEKLWIIIQDFNSLFFNGQDFLKTANFIIKTIKV